VKKFLFLSAIFLFFLAIAGFSQDYTQDEAELEDEAALDDEIKPKKRERGDIWLSPCGETAIYGVSGPAVGGGIALGYGSGTSIGLKAAWFLCPDGTSTLELSFLFRLYFPKAGAFSGPFLQFTGGPALFFTESGELKIPAEHGMVTAGLSFGWRFLFMNRWFVEPSIRGGYPYLVGAGLSAGVRF